MTTKKVTRKNPTPTKYLIFSVTNEFESMVAVVEWTPKYAGVVQDRMAMATEMQKADNSFAWLMFYDGTDLYEGSSTIEEWIADHADKDAWERDLMVVTETKPAFPESDTVRVDMAYMQVDDKGCFWEIRPKHSDQSLSTMMVYADTEGLFPKR